MGPEYPIAQFVGQLRELKQEAWDQARLEAYRVGQLMQFFRGFQWEHGDHELFGELTPQHPDAERTRLNMVRRLISAYASMVSGSFDTFTVNARSASSEAEIKARHTRKVVSAIWRSDSYFPLEERYKAVLYGAIQGGSWVKVTYDPTKYRDDPERIEGDIDVQVFTRNDVYPDPAAKREEDVSYIFENETIPIALAFSRYTTDIFGQPTDARHFERSRPEETFADLGAVHNSGFEWTQSYREGSRNYEVTITKVWWKPSRQFPKGLFVAYSGETVFSMSPLPFEFPWVFFPGPNPVPNRLYPDGMLMDLENPQQDMNEISARIMEWIKACTNPTLLTHISHNLSAGDFEDIPGSVVQYSGSMEKPSWMNPPAPPGQLFQVVSDRLELMKLQAAVSEINLGQVPTDDFSGRAVAILQDLQRSSHGAAFSSYFRASSRVLRKMLKIAQRFWPDGKPLLSGTSGSRSDIEIFRQTEFDADALVTLQPAAGVKSETAQRAEKMELFTAGAFDDMPAAARLRAELGMTGPESDSLTEVHLDKALRENVAVQGGYTPEVDPLDDHEIHFHAHQRGVFADDMNPQQKRMLAEHAMLHAQYLMPPVPPPGAEGRGGMPEEGGLPVEEELAQEAEAQAESPMNGGIGDLEAASATGRSPGPGG